MAKQDQQPSPAALLAAALTEIQLGIAMARASGVVCGSPKNIRVRPNG